MTARHLIPTLVVAGIAIVAPLLDSSQQVPSDGPQFLAWLKSQGCQGQVVELSHDC